MPATSSRSTTCSSVSRKPVTRSTSPRWSKGGLHLVVHDSEPDWETYVERPGRGIVADVAFSEVDPSRYAAVLIPGGRAPEVIRNDPDVQRIVTHFFDNDLPVGHMCHDVQISAAIGRVRGRRCSAYPPLAPAVEAAGGEFVDGADVVDGAMVSARGWEDLPEYCKAFPRSARRGVRPRLEVES